MSENKKNTNVVAIIGFIFSILSIPTLGFISIVGLVLSIVGLAISKKYSKPLKGLSIAGLIISSLCFILFWGLVISSMISGDSSSSPVVTPIKVLKEVTVIDFSSMNKEDIEKWCSDNNITCHFDTDYSDEIPEGSFIKQSDAPNTKVKEESTIVITYSLGHKKTPEEIAEEEKNTFKASCQAYSYEEISRNPDNYKGLPAVFTGQVAQVMEASYSSTVVLRVNVTQGEYGWWDDTIYVTYTMPEGRARILDNDIVTIYGELDGLESYTAVLGNTITIPRLKAKYIE